MNTLNTFASAAALLLASTFAAAQPKWVDEPPDLSPRGKSPHRVFNPNAMETQPAMCYPKQAGGTGDKARQYGNADGEVFLWACTVDGKKVYRWVADLATSRSTKIRLNAMSQAELLKWLKVKEVESGYYNWSRVPSIPALAKKHEKD